MKASAGSKFVKAVLVILIILSALAVFSIQEIPKMEVQWAKDVANSQEFRDFSMNESILTYLLAGLIVVLILIFVLPHLRRKKPETLTEKVKGASKTLGKAVSNVNAQEPKQSKLGRRIKWIFICLVVVLLLIIVLGIQVLPTMEGTKEIVNSDAFRIASKGVWIPASFLFWIIILVALNLTLKIVRKVIKKPAGEKKHKWLLKIGNFVFFLILLAVVFLLTTAFWPAQNDVVVSDPINTQVFAALSQGGIIQSNTVIENDAIHVSYQLPNGLSKEQADLFILGVLSNMNIHSKEAWLSAYKDNNLLGETHVQMSDVLARKRGELTDEGLRERFG